MGFGAMELNIYKVQRIHLPLSSMQVFIGFLLVDDIHMVAGGMTTTATTRFS